MSLLKKVRQSVVSSTKTAISNVSNPKNLLKSTSNAASLPQQFARSTIVRSAQLGRYNASIAKEAIRNPSAAIKPSVVKQELAFGSTPIADSDKIFIKGNPINAALQQLNRGVGGAPGRVGEFARKRPLETIGIVYSIQNLARGLFSGGGGGAASPSAPTPTPTPSPTPFPYEELLPVVTGTAAKLLTKQGGGPEPDQSMGWQGGFFIQLLRLLLA